MTSPSNTRVPTVSVIIPVYNRSETVGEAIASVLRQTYGDFEVVVVDDGSTDDSRAVVAAIDDDRVRLVAAEHNLGAAGARNLGVTHAAGDWIAFQDSDDEWLPRKLERQMATVAGGDPETVAAYCGMVRIGGVAARGIRLRVDYVPDVSVERVRGDILDSLLGTSLISTQTLVVRREVFNQLGGFDLDTTPIEDWDLAIRLARIGPIELVDEALVVQRFSTDSITHNVERRLAAQSRVVEKYSDIYATRPAILSSVHYTIAGGHRRNRNYGLAAGYLARARRARPRSIRTWAMSAFVSLGRLLSWRPFRRS